MTDRELMQQALECMEAAIKAGDWKVDGACDPDFVLLCLRTRLAQHEPVRVSPQEFIRAVEGKENLVGMPVMWTEWPTKEKNADQ
jgi:hypothetical protein